MSKKSVVSCLGKDFLAFLCVLCVAVLTEGCGGSMFMPQPISVAVSPQTAAVGTSQTMQFMAVVNNDSTGVTWTATAGDGDGNGSHTPPPGAQSTGAPVGRPNTAAPTDQVVSTAKREGALQDTPPPQLPQLPSSHCPT